MLNIGNERFQWIFENNRVKCSRCGNKVETNTNFDENEERKSYFIRSNPYCAECGAKMKRLDNSAQTGHWIVKTISDDGYTETHCSCCKSIVYADKEFAERTKYCRQCGAEMSITRQE